MAISLTIAGTTIRVGDTVSVQYKIIEKEVVSGKTKKEKHEEQKERTQAFNGTVIAMSGGGNNASFCVRHIGVGGVGVERIFPVVSPWIKKVVVTKKGNVRRAKLYYLRDKTTKELAQIAQSSKAETGTAPKPKTSSNVPTTS